MEYGKFGRTSEDVGAIALGTMTWGLRPNPVQ